SYETADGKHVAIGAIEPQFYARLRAATGLADDPDFDAQMDPAAWPALKDRLAAIFRTRTRDQWCALMEGTAACFAPVLSMAEAPGHPHNAARGAFIERAGVVQPAPAPRFAAAQDSTSATTSKS
ncbi:CoA transferase, partial [Staphylococcus aureus]